MSEVKYTEELIYEVYQIGKSMYNKYQSWKDGPNKKYWDNTYDMATWYFDNHLRYLSMYELMELYYSTSSPPENELDSYWQRIILKNNGKLYTSGHIYTAEDIAYYFAFRHINSEKYS